MVPTNPIQQEFEKSCRRVTPFRQTFSVTSRESKRHAATVRNATLARRVREECDRSPRQNFPVEEKSPVEPRIRPAELVFLTGSRVCPGPCAAAESNGHVPFCDVPPRWQSPEARRSAAKSTIQAVAESANSVVGHPAPSLPLECGKRNGRPVMLRQLHRLLPCITLALRSVR
jgi:hypothetical protein